SAGRRVAPPILGSLRTVRICVQTSRRRRRIFSSALLKLARVQVLTQARVTRELGVVVTNSCRDRAELSPSRTSPYRLFGFWLDRPNRIQHPPESVVGVIKTHARSPGEKFGQQADVF